MKLKYFYQFILITIVFFAVCLKLLFTGKINDCEIESIRRKYFEKNNN